MPDEARAAETPPATGAEAVVEDQSGLLETVIRRTYQVPPPVFATPTSWESVETLARKIGRAGWAPKSHCDQSGQPNVASIELAILQGMELGVPPLMAVQGIAIINGVPAVWGDLMLALVSASGLLEFKDERYEKGGNGDGDEGATAVCTVKRVGRPEPIVRKFSMKMAQRAGLTNKKGPWQAYPLRMLAMRARSWALRDEFSDVLKGLHSVEELSDPDALEQAIDAKMGVAPPPPQRSDFTQAAAPSSDQPFQEQAKDTADEPEADADTPEPYTLVDCDGEAHDYQQPGRWANALEKVFDEAARRGEDVLEGMWETNSPTLGRLRGENRGDLADRVKEHQADLRNRLRAASVADNERKAGVGTDSAASDDRASTGAAEGQEADGPPPGHPATDEMY